MHKTYQNFLTLDNVKDFVNNCALVVVVSIITISFNQWTLRYCI